jgi:hypothetical protein
MLYITFRARAIGAEVVSHYGFGFAKMMRLRLCNTDFSHQHFQYLSFSANYEKNLRTFGHNNLKQWLFELFSKSGGFL